MDTRGLANADVSPALFPRGLQSRTSRPMAMDIEQGSGVNEVALMFDAAEVLDRAVFAVASGAHLTRPVRLDQLSGQPCSLA
jgi:hypothetical protein